MFLDIETSQMLVWVWSLNDPANQYISHENIEQEAAIICVCWKWAKEKKVHSLTWDKKLNDKKLLREFLPELEKATEVVAHNGDRFDIRWIRGRCLIHRIPMSPRLPSVDTLKNMRSKFKLPSYRLDYAGQKATDEGKIRVGLDLWKAVQRGDPVALGKMVRYCKRDVVKLEQTYDWIAPYLEPVTSIATHPSHCPECNSDQYTHHKARTLKSGQITHQFRCRDCGRHWTVGHQKLRKNKRFPGLDD